MASLFVTYVLWLFGGIFGLHHLYLGRVSHAFMWCVTLGGVCGLGWLRDLWRIPFYVRWRNGEKECQKEHLDLIASGKRPSGGLIRSLGMFVMGYLASIVLCGLLPDYRKSEMEISQTTILFYRVCTGLLTIVGSSVGVHIVANVGEIQCPYVYSLVGTLLGSPWLVISESNVSVPITVASIVTWYFGMQWRPIKPKATPRRGIFNLLIFLTCVSVWSALFGYGIYYHGEVTLNDGQSIPVRVALRNFFASPAWYRLRHSFHQLWIALVNDGWESAFNDAIDIFDFSGEGNALEVLGLEENASRVTIARKCRKLSSLYHPDRQKTPAAKAQAEEKFLEIREACSVLTRKPYQRSRNG